MAHFGQTIMNQTITRWKSLEAAQKVADACTADDQGSVYEVKLINDRYIIAISDDVGFLGYL